MLPLDDPAIVPERRRASRRLSRLVAVASIDDGAEAVTALTASRPDLVLSAGVAGAAVGSYAVTLAASEGFYLPLTEITEMGGASSSVAWAGGRLIPYITDLVALIGFLLRKCSLTDLDDSEGKLKTYRNFLQDTKKRQ